VVTIDDIDRLEPRELGELLRLVRSVAHFPSLSYLLCYDTTILKHVVEKATGVAPARRLDTHAGTNTMWECPAMISSTVSKNVGPVPASSVESWRPINSAL